MKNKITKKAALKIFSLPLEEALKTGEKFRRAYKGNEVSSCAIVNAKSGACAENCKFCAQSVYNKASSPKYPLVSAKKLSQAASKAIKSGAACFGIVTSGNALSNNEFAELCSFVKGFKNASKLGFSVGTLSEAQLKALKKTGVSRIHHNLETSKKFFPNICTTHTYAQRVKNIRLAQKLGFKICSGGLFGIGESLEDRVDLAFELKKLNVDSMPINFFVNHKGTRVGKVKKMSADEMLKTIAMFRYVNPSKHITVCGGRALLGDKQNLIFMAGASGVMVGDYLTVKGAAVKEDLKMIKKAGYIHTDKG